MAKNVTVSLDLDVSGLRKQLDVAIAYLKKIAGETPTVDIAVDDDQVDEARKKVDGLSGTEHVTVDVDTKGADKAVGGLGSKLGGLGSLAAGAAGGLAAGALTSLTHGLVEGAQAADDFGDKLEVAFQQQGVEDIDAEIEKVNASTLELANNLGLPAARTRELAGTVATLGGFTGKSAEDLTKLSAGLEVFTDGAVKGEQVAKAFARGINDPEGAAAIDALSKKYPQLADVLKSNIDPAEKLRIANEQLGKSFETVKEQQNDAGGILNRLQNTLGELFEKIGSQLLDAIAPLAQTLLPILEQSIGFIGQILEPLKPVLEQVIGAVAKIVTSLSGPAMGLLMAVLNPLIDLFLQLLPVILQLVDVAIPPLVQIINIVAQAFADLLPALQPIMNMIIMLLPPIGQLVGSLLNALVPVIRTVVQVAVTLVKALLNNEVVMGTLYNIIKQVSGVLQFLSTIFDGVAYVANIVGTAISVVVEKIGNLVTAIASFDLGKIKAAISDFGNTGSDIQKRLNAGAAATKTAAAETQNLAAEQSKLNTELNKQPPPKKTKETGDEAKKLAEELKRAKDALAELNAEQKKQRDLNTAETLQSVSEREQKKQQIETEFQIAALEKERKALETSGELRATQEAIINKKIEILREQSQIKLRAIEGKAAAERVKQEQENEKLLGDVAAAAADKRVKELQEKLAAGNAEVAADLIKAQRAIIDSNLSAQIDAITESAPKFKEAAKELQRSLEAGALSPEAYTEAITKLRQETFAALQAEPEGTTNAYAQKIRAAYEQASDAILDNTRSVLQQVNELMKAEKLPTYTDSLIGLADALAAVDYASLFGNTAETIAGITEEQQALVDAVREGNMTFQEASGELATLQSEVEATNSALLQAMSAAFTAVAEQQKAQADAALSRANELLTRNQEIAVQLVELEKLKAAELQAVAADDAAKKLEIEKRFTEAKDALNKESAENTSKANEMTALSYANLASSAAASFTSMVLGGENALKALVVAALDALNALIPVLVAQITGVQLASPNPANALSGGAWGIASAAALTAVLYAAVAAAKAAVTSGFKSGGYTGDVGVNTVAGVVHGNEFVMNASATRQHRGLLEHLHSGRSLESYPALQKMLHKNNITTIPLTEVQLMRAELTAIKQTLQQMPQGIQRNIGVDVNVGMDTYLYERDRRRMNARNLKG